PAAQPPAARPPAARPNAAPGQPTPAPAQPATGAAGAAAPAAPQLLTVAVIPSQYFEADPDSANKLTDGIRQSFTGNTAQQWNVLPQDAVKTACDAMGFK